MDFASGLKIGSKEVHMAFVHVNFYSDTLKINTDLTIIIPTPGPDDGDVTDRSGKSCLRP